MNGTPTGRRDRPAAALAQVANAVAAHLAASGCRPTPPAPGAALPVSVIGVLLPFRVLFSRGLLLST